MWPAGREFNTSAVTFQNRPKGIRKGFVETQKALSLVFLESLRLSNSFVPFLPRTKIAVKEYAYKKVETVSCYLITESWIFIIVQLWQQPPAPA